MGCGAGRGCVAGRLVGDWMRRRRVDRSVRKMVVCEEGVYMVLF